MLDKRWYVVQCKPRDSFRAELQLRNQHFECYHPTLTIKRKRAGQIISVVAPLFPYYLFILLGNEDNWIKIRSTRGVSRLVCFNGVPATLDQSIISGLQYHCAKMQGEELDPLYKVGDRVKVTEGCFKHLEAIVTASTSEERITLLLNLFNREQQIIVSANNVEKL